MAADAGEKQGVAVGRRARRELGADAAAGARPVVDHHRLAQIGAELQRHGARHDVIAAAGRERDDQVHRLRRIGLCDGQRRGEQKER